MSIRGETHTTVTIERSTTPLRLPVRRATITMDEEWTPYIQAELECALGDGTIAQLNPQAADTWATIEVRRSLGRIDRLEDITRRYRGKSIADITMQFRSKTLAAITRSIYHDYSTPGVARREEVRTFKLMLRSVSVDQKDATVRIELASGEARLMDWAHMSSQSDRIAGANMTAKLNFILNLSGFPAGITYVPASVPTDAQIGDEAIRAPASTALDFVTTLTRKHGLMLWCDEAGLWHLSKDRSRSGTRTVYTSGDDRSVINEVSTRSRDEDWVTSVMIVYTWAGVDHYDIYSPLAPNPERALVLRYDRPYPGPGTAEQIFKNVNGRGRAMDLTAVSNYLATPGETIRYESPRETVSGRLASVRWQLPEDEMSIRIRSVKAA